MESPAARAVFAIGLLPMLLLSGCSSKSRNSSEATLTPEAITSALVGRVTTPDLVAIAGAHVGIDLQKLNTTTDADGHYQFLNPQPGHWVLTATKEGYKTRFDKVTLTEGATLLFNLTLEEAPLAHPYHETQPFNGQVTCQLVYGNSEGSDRQECGNLDPNNKPSRIFSFDANPAQVQVEVFWSPTTLLARQLTLTVEARTNGAGDNLANSVGKISEETGPSGLKAVLTPALMEKYFRTGGSVLVTVGAGMSATGGFPADAGVALQQPFEVAFTTFYYEPGPDDFSAREE